MGSEAYNARRLTAAPDPTQTPAPPTLTLSHAHSGPPSHLPCLKPHVQVAIVTAAGYPGEEHKFEGRLAGLLEAFRTQTLPAEITDRCPALHWGWGGR